MFARILIANRGEIACRVIRTAQKMGIGTVAVYSDADTDALHVRLADDAVRIGPAPAAESYLNADRIIAAALESGAEAIHPGYGFLSENPAFVEAVEAAGLVFIGPSAASIRAMGLKDAAKQLMEKAGVPVVPGYHGEAQELVVIASKAREVGYPVLIKARAGGGGKGMRRVDNPDHFAEALAGARREAKSSFGDDRVLVEKYISTPRHIEVQVFGDKHGNVVHLFERDCSLQRRHQKVIEEAPAPGMTEEMRTAMTDAAVKAAQAINYSGAGTIEFIVDASEGLHPDRFWFMEMNTRLQVEHPVTEMITGLDLVEWQIRVAAGEKLPKTQKQIRQHGHAFEARIYAEDASKGFLPAIGTLHHVAFPTVADDDDVQIRVDSGIASGDAISPYYDPMIAKLIVHGPDRQTALSALAQALTETEIAGSVTNTAFLAALARHEEFAAGQVDTGLIERDLSQMISSAERPAGTLELAALIASGLLETPPEPDPWSSVRSYAHFLPPMFPVRIGDGDTMKKLGVRTLSADRFAIAGDQGDIAVRVRKIGGKWQISGHDIFLTASVARSSDEITLFTNGAAFRFTLPDPLAREADAAAFGDRISAPMPGLVKLVRVTAGDRVQKGQSLLVLEAMKMEHAITAPHDGTIAEIVSEGSQIKEGTTLVRFEDIAQAVTA